MPDERLRRQILGAIGRGLLPARLPHQTWGGFGEGGICAACGKPITTEHLETEFEDAQRVAFHLHIQCFAAWEAVITAGLADAPLPASTGDRYSAAGDFPSQNGSR